MASHIFTSNSFFSEAAEKRHPTLQEDYIYKNNQAAISVWDDIPRNLLAPGFANLLLILFLKIQAWRFFLYLPYGTRCTGYDKHS